VIQWDNSKVHDMLGVDLWWIDSVVDVIFAETHKGTYAELTPYSHEICYSPSCEVELTLTSYEKKMQNDKGLEG